MGAYKKTFEQLYYQAWDKSFQVIIEAKHEGGSLLTLDAFAEMINLDKIIHNDVFYEMTDVKDDDKNLILAGGYDAYYPDICKKFLPITSYDSSPITYANKQEVSFHATILT